MSRRNGMGDAAWYRRKLPRGRYAPRCEIDLNYENLPVYLPDWNYPTEEQIANWEDDKFVIEQKNQKRDYFMEYGDPQRVESGKLEMRIEVLHLKRKGFLYSCQADTEESLNLRFWPVVNQLLAYFCSPRIIGRPAPQPE